jgi:predicted PurR-regulated permease PerM
MSDKSLTISTETILIFFGVLLGLLGLWLVRDILLILFVSIIIVLTLEPFVAWLDAKKVPRSAAVFGTVIVFIMILVGVASAAIIPLQQVSKLIVSLPAYIQALTSLPILSGYQIQISDAIYSQLSLTTGNIILATINAFSGLMTMVAVFIFVIYMLLDFHNIRKMFIKLFALRYQPDVNTVVKRIEVKLGGWLRGQIILMILIGVTTYIGLVLLGVDYALALAVIAGVLEIVPIIGPVLSAIPALIVAFTISPLTGLGVLGLYILIQQLENSYVVPKVMQKAVGFSPLVTILALMVGGSVFGLVGAVLAIPISIVTIEVIKYFMYEKH